MFSLVITEKEKDLPLDMAGYLSPSLFIAVNGLEGYTQKFSHFFLCFSQFFPGSCKFCGIQLNLLDSKSSYYS
jgi:hypothetical protein